MLQGTQLRSHIEKKPYTQKMNDIDYTYSIIPKKTKVFRLHPRPLPPPQKHRIHFLRPLISKQRPFTVPFPRRPPKAQNVVPSCFD
jgi:hypothetical protein